MWHEIVNSKYRYYERYKDSMTGKVRRVCVTLDRKSDNKARQLLDLKISDKLSRYSDKTLSQAIELYQKDSAHYLRKSTHQRNMTALTSMKNLLGGSVLLNKLTAAFIREQLLDSGKKARTLNEYMTRFTTFIRWAYRYDLIASTACIDKMKQFKEDSMRTRIKDKYLDTDEIRKLLEEMTDPGYKLITEFLLLTGLRIGELCALEDKDVGEVIHITKTYNPVTEEITPGKTPAAVRDIYVNAELADCIKRLRSVMRLRRIKTGSRLFVVNPEGERLKYYTFNKYFRTVSERILGRRLSSHILRHTHASMLAAQGYGLDAISRRLGHDNSTVTKNIYIHVTKEMQKADAEKMEKITLLPFFCPFPGDGTTEKCSEVL